MLLRKLAMLLRKLAMLSRVSKVIQKDKRRSEILKGLIFIIWYIIFHSIDSIGVFLKVKFIIKNFILVYNRK